MLDARCSMLPFEAQQQRYQHVLVFHGDRVIAKTFDVAYKTNVSGFWRIEMHYKYASTSTVACKLTLTTVNGIMLYKCARTSEYECNVQWYY